MKIALSLALLLAACDTAYVGTATTPYAEDPCSFQIYQTPGCNAGYDWSPGHYDSFNVWVRPRYSRRVIIAPSYHTTVIHSTPRTTYTVRPTVTRTTVIRPTTRTTVIRSSPTRSSYSPSTRSTYTVTRRSR